MTTPAVVFPVGSDSYAVAAATVREIVCGARPTRLPTAPAILLGAFNLRGEVVPMFDTAMVLGVGSLANASVVVVVDTVSGPAGLAASGLPKVVVLDDAITTSDLQGTLGIFAVDDDEFAVLIDVESLLQTHPGIGAPSVHEELVGQ